MEYPLSQPLQPGPASIERRSLSHTTHSRRHYASALLPVAAAGAQLKSLVVVRNLLILPLRARVVRMQSPRHKSALFPYFGGRRCDDGRSSPGWAAGAVQCFRRGGPLSRQRHAGAARRSNVIDRAVMFVDPVTDRVVCPCRLQAADAISSEPSTGG